MGKTKRVQDIDPLDPTDARVKVEAFDQLGQIFAPGDFIAYRAYSGIAFGKVIWIQALRMDGSPLSNGDVKTHIHAIRRDVYGEWYFSYYKHSTDWDHVNRCYTKHTILPVHHAIRWPVDLIRCDAVKDLDIKDNPEGAI